MKNNGFAPLIIVLVIAVLGTGGYLVYSKKDALLPTSKSSSSKPTSTPLPTGTIAATVTPSVATDKPIVYLPSSGSTVASPLSIAGSVPPGWMFEGVFPIKLVDSRRNLIVEGQAKEKTPGTWMSGSAVDFIANLRFSTTAKSGYLILENDNPSGDPANAKTFEVPVKF